MNAYFSTPMTGRTLEQLEEHLQRTKDALKKVESQLRPPNYIDGDWIIPWRGLTVDPDRVTGMGEKHIGERAVMDIRKSDVVFVYAKDEISTGVAIEIGMAAALRKPVIIYSQAQLSKLSPMLWYAMISWGDSLEFAVKDLAWFAARYKLEVE